MLFPSSSCLFTLLILLLLPQSSYLLSIQDQNGGIVTLELWCVAKNNADDSALQSALDWACGPGGSNCSPIQQGGPCYDPQDILKMASFAFNDYYLHHNLTEDSCDFSNTAALTSLNPSQGNCKFPSSFSVNNGSARDSSTSVNTGGAAAGDMSGNDHHSDNRWSLMTVLLLSAVQLIFC